MPQLFLLVFWTSGEFLCDRLPSPDGPGDTLAALSGLKRIDWLATKIPTARFRRYEAD